MFEYIIEDNAKTLSEKQKAPLLGSIVSKYQKWNDSRTQQLDDAKLIRDGIYQRNNKNKKEWRSQIKLPEIYELAQTLKAHLWESIYSNPEGMFDVFGKTREAQSFANVQKAALVNSFDEMNLTPELDKSINNLVEIGESVLFVGWETKTKQIRTRKPYTETIIDIETGEQKELEKEKFVIENKITFDGAKIRSVEPENFVFDKDNFNNWDNCGKIQRSFSTIEDIETNLVYSLSKQDKEELDALCTDAKSDEFIKENQLELLEYWGDIKLEDGTVLRNWLVTIAARTKIIRFEANPFIINPFICANFIEDPGSKRGVSPLRIALVFNEIASDILNRQLDALALITNPPYLAPKGCFTGKQEVSPGKIIEYDAALMPQSPVPLKFDSALQGWEFIQFFKGSTESSTGVFKNMVGNSESSKRTATEVNYTIGGQSTRLSLAVDNINQRIIIPMVEKVADLIAAFKFGKEILSAQVGGNVVYIEIDDNVRCADYKYRYGDRKSTQEKKYRFKELFDVISGFSKVSDVAQKIDWLECFKYALEQYGIENPAQFISK